MSKHDLTAQQMYEKEANKVNYFHRSCLVLMVLSFFFSIAGAVEMPISFWSLVFSV